MLFQLSTPFLYQIPASLIFSGFLFATAWVALMTARIFFTFISISLSFPFVKWESFLKQTHRRANARNVSFQSLYGGQFTLSTQLLNTNFCVSRPHRRSTTVSLETNSIPANSLWFIGVTFLSWERQDISYGTDNIPRCPTISEDVRRFPKAFRLMASKSMLWSLKITQSSSRWVWPCL